MKKINYYWLFGFLTMTSCKSEHASKMENYIIGNIILNSPEKMQFVPDKGVDSYIAFLIDQKNDTLYIEYGRREIIDNLHEFGVTAHVFPIDFKNSIRNQSGKTPTDDEALFSKYPKEDEEEKIFSKNYFMYDTINSIVVKIVQPKKIGNGITGMYVPELRNGRSFSIYGRNLDSAQQKITIQMFRTLHYKDDKI